MIFTLINVKHRVPSRKCLVFSEGMCHPRRRYRFGQRRRAVFRGTASAPRLHRSSSTAEEVSAGVGSFQCPKLSTRPRRLDPGLGRGFIRPFRQKTHGKRSLGAHLDATLGQHGTDIPEMGKDRL